MYENQTYEVILQRMLDRVSDTLDKRESSLIFDTASSSAIEFVTLYIELDTMIQNSFGDTASRDFLIRLCADRGITPEAASKAVLKGVFVPNTIDVTGQRFNIGQINYVVTEKISDGVFKVQCESAGVIGNQYLGTMVPMEYIEGLQSATLTEVLIPGEDEEDTEDLRSRYIESFSQQSFGGNRADYLANVRSMDGVGDVKLKRVWNSDIEPSSMIPNAAVQSWYSSFIGTASEDVAAWLTPVYTAAKNKKLTVGGTVLAVLVDSDDYGAASSALVDSVQTALDPTQNAGDGYGIAPIGHVVTVQSAEAVTVNVTTVLTFEDGYSWSNLQTALNNAVSAYLLGLRKSWADESYLVVRVSQLESFILAVDGVTDISGTEINGHAENLVLTEYQIPVFGGIADGS